MKKPGLSFEKTVSWFTYEEISKTEAEELFHDLENHFKMAKVTCKWTDVGNFIIKIEYEPLIYSDIQYIHALRPWSGVSFGINIRM
jgi:hypothetical protein